MNYKLIIDKQALSDIQHIMVSKPLVTENVNHATFQVLLTLRALELYMKERQVEPIFTVDYTDTVSTKPVKETGGSDL